VTHPLRCLVAFEQSGMMTAAADQWAGAAGLQQIEETDND
jgi:hypothetical protein